MRWIRHHELSDDDLDRLNGTKLMSQLMRNKLIVKYHDEETPATPKEMGLRECVGLYFMRGVDSTGHKIYEILFELKEDLEQVEEHLTQYKLGLG